MEIEAKPIITMAYARVPMDYIISAVSQTMGEAEREAFLEAARNAIHSNIQKIAEVAFERGREYERRNPKGQP